MTVSTNSNTVVYTGDGLSSAFSFQFPVYLQTDLIVSVYRISTGVLTQLTISTNYTVSLTKISGKSTYLGTVTLLGAYAALSSDYKIFIQRVVPISQLISLQDNSQTPAATYEEGYDRAVMIAQQLYEEISRAVILPIGENSITPTELLEDITVAVSVCQAAQVSAAASAASAAASAALAGGSYVTTFTNASLSTGVLTVTHNLNSTNVACSILDNTGAMIIPDSVIVTGVNTLTVSLVSFGTIAGTWSVRVAK